MFVFEKQPNIQYPPYDIQRQTAKFNAGKSRQFFVYVIK